MPKSAWVVKALVLGLIVVVAQGCVSVGKYNDLQDNYRRLQMQLNDANAKLASLESDLDREKAVSTNLSKDLEALRKLKAAFGEVEIGPGGQLIIADEVLFDSGKAVLKKRGKEILAGVARMLNEQGKCVRIDGHTDSDPIKHSGWPSNHHLSAARALAVYEEFLHDGVAEGKMHVVGWGPNAPRASNSSSDGKAKNRRVEILPLRPDQVQSLLPKGGAMVAPENIPAAPAPKKEKEEAHPKT